MKLVSKLALALFAALAFLSLGCEPHSLKEETGKLHAGHGHGHGHDEEGHHGDEHHGAKEKGHGHEDHGTDKKSKKADDTKPGQARKVGI